MSKSNLEILIEFHNNDPKCYWCRENTILLVDPIQRRNQNGECNFALNATIDHLYPKGHPNRYLRPMPKVLSCRECNNSRPNPWAELRCIIKHNQKNKERRKKRFVQHILRAFTFNPV
jgi:hypothetical protein